MHELVESALHKTLLVAAHCASGRWLYEFTCRTAIRPPSPLALQALSAVRGLRGVLSVAATTGIAAGASLALAQATLLPASGSSDSPAPSTLASPAALLAPLLVKGSMPLALLASAALCGLARRYLGRLERRLVFTDYLHFDK